MNTVSAARLQQFKAWIQEDWPNDPLMQEIHFIRLVRQEEMKKMSDEEVVAYYKSIQNPVKKRKKDAA